jgi:UDP-N-acetylenolpyruvoylglucosamine reductase
VAPRVVPREEDLTKMWLIEVREEARVMAPTAEKKAAKEASQKHRQKQILVPVGGNGSNLNEENCKTNVPKCTLTTI